MTRHADLPPLVLASGSPRRRELLAALGLRFEVRPADVDETAHPGEDAPQLVERLSLAKAERVADSCPESLVLAADTVVVLGDETLGKPADVQENLEFLKRLSGQRHEVLTGHCLILSGRRISRVCRTEVRFRRLDQDEIERYVASGEGLDKAGGYAIQGRGSALVPHLVGCYFNVVGLSVATVAEMARELGVRLV